MVTQRFSFFIIFSDSDTSKTVSLLLTVTWWSMKVNNFGYLPCWLLFLVVFFSFIQGYSGTLTPEGSATPWGSIMVWYAGWWAPGLMEPPVPGECCRLLSPANCGNAVMNSAMEGWLLMKPVSADPHVGSMAGWWVPCGGSPAGVLAPAATVASQKPPPPSFARTGVVGLVFTVDSSLLTWTKFWRWSLSCRLWQLDNCDWRGSSSGCTNVCCLLRMEQYASTCTCSLFLPMTNVAIKEWLVNYW